MSDTHQSNPAGPTAPNDAVYLRQSFERMLVHAGDVIRHSGNTPDTADEQAKARDGLTQELERFDDMCDSILIALKTLKHQAGAATQDSPVTTTAVPASMTPTVSDTEPSVRSVADDWRRAQLDELRRLVLDPLA